MSNDTTIDVLADFLLRKGPMNIEPLAVRQRLAREILDLVDARHDAHAQCAPDERRAFEKWLPDHLMPSEFSPCFLFKTESDRYAISFVQDAWDGWMARAALTSTDRGGK